MTALETEFLKYLQKTNQTLQPEDAVRALGVQLHDIKTAGEMLRRNGLVSSFDVDQSSIPLYYLTDKGRTFPN
jgi:hypothetical protein